MFNNTYKNSVYSKSQHTPIKVFMYLKQHRFFEQYNFVEQNYKIIPYEFRFSVF